MKPITIFILFALFIVLTSCTDVVDVDLPTSEPALVVEASIEWQKGTAGNNQSISLRTTTPYYQNQQASPVIGASVKITNDKNGTEFLFEDQHDGVYKTDSFIPILNQPYTLHISYEGEKYTATEFLLPVVEIEEVTQSQEGGFDDKVMELNISFQDPENEKNYYLLKVFRQGDSFPYMEVQSDELTNGNRIEEFFEIEDDEESSIEPLKQGDVMETYLYGISERYYNYMALLISQSDDGGPFGTVPVPLHGNCINTTHPKEEVYGYFRLTEVDKRIYTVK